MIDLDQAELKGIADAPDPTHLVELGRRTYVLVPLDSLQRVSRPWDCDHIRLRRDRKFGK